MNARAVGKSCILAAAIACAIALATIVPTFANQLGEVIDRYHRLATSKTLLEDTEYGSREALELHRACAFSRYEEACTKQIGDSEKQTFARTPWAIAVAYKIRGEIRERRGNLQGALSDYTAAHARHNFRNLDAEIAKLKKQLRTPDARRRSGEAKVADAQPVPQASKAEGSVNGKLQPKSSDAPAMVPPLKSTRKIGTDADVAVDAESVLTGYPLKVHRRISTTTPQTTVSEPQTPPAAAAPLSEPPSPPSTVTAAVAASDTDHSTIEAGATAVFDGRALTTGSIATAAKGVAAFATAPPSIAPAAITVSARKTGSGTAPSAGSSSKFYYWPAFTLLLASTLSIALLVVARSAIGEPHGYISILKGQIRSWSPVRVAPRARIEPPAMYVAPQINTAAPPAKAAISPAAGARDEPLAPERPESVAANNGSVHQPAAVDNRNGQEREAAPQIPAAQSPDQPLDRTAAECATPIQHLSRTSESAGPLDQAVAAMISDVLNLNASMLIVHGHASRTRHLTDLVTLRGGPADPRQLEIVQARQLSLRDFLGLFGSDLSHLKALEFEKTLNALFDLQCYACEPFLGEDFIRHHRSTLRHIFRLLQEIPSANIDTLNNLLHQTETPEFAAYLNRLRTPSSRDFFATKYRGMEFKKFALAFTRKLEILNAGDDPSTLADGRTDSADTVSSLRPGQFLILDFGTTELSALRETSIRAKIAEFAMPYLNADDPASVHAPTFVLIDNAEHWFSRTERSQNMIVGYLARKGRHAPDRGQSLDGMFNGLSSVPLDGIGKVGKFFEEAEPRQN